MNLTLENVVDPLHIIWWFRLHYCCVRVCETYHSLQLCLLPVHVMHVQEVVAEVERLKPLLLAEEGDDGEPRPLQTLPTPLPGGGMCT